MRIKFLRTLILMFLVSACHLKEEVYINEDGSGNVTAESLRDESIYMKYLGEDYFKEQEFVDSTYVVKDVIAKEQETFDVFLEEYQALLRKYENVKVHIKKDSYAKEYRTTISTPFKNINDAGDLSHVTDYVDDLQNNYAINPSRKRTIFAYNFDGTTFRRTFKVLNQERYDEYKETIELYKPILHIGNCSYTANYHFPRKIKSVSHTDAILSEDRKSLTLKLPMLDCLEKPELAFLEVVLED
ncbi:hypothetical protein J2X31_000953 [Flavobacterium arsenatis]|uniref:Lipoprotein n=1 Tax=Flavobacterium arsenatis TaxID=1484332 RepID=A0ABU1TNF2_9FLAO|nr:hypothetical protein [Flavobacterium arsenatis]MDR6966953.1 hypothetical protein [Flavobacterium arsenatis]